MLEDLGTDEREVANAAQASTEKIRLALNAPLYLKFRGG
jgi:hypothetical protein